MVQETPVDWSTYALLKLIHVTCVALSGAGFAARGMLMLVRSPMLRARWLRVAPHVVDSLLLMSAIALAWQAQLSPLTHSWLAAKIMALLAYIVLGTIALKRGRTLRTRALAFVAALMTFGYIVSVALTRDPTPWWT